MIPLASPIVLVLVLVVVLVLDLFAREQYHPVGSIDYGFFDHKTAYQRPRTRTTTRTRTIW
jgi:hypothetical protein